MTPEQHETRRAILAKIERRQLGENDNCGGSGPHTPGEVRILCLGSSPDHGNVILCFSCYQREIAWRREKNKTVFHPFKLPAWDECEIYRPI